MKRIFCSKCDEQITISSDSISQARETGRLDIVCPLCGKQLKVRIRSGKSDRKASTKDADAVLDAELDRSYGFIEVIENQFGYRQEFALREGLNHIGRRNKDTVTDIPIITADPSMSRHHSIIKLRRKKSGQLEYSIADDESTVGTFVAGELLQRKEFRILPDKAVITLGATTIILHQAERSNEAE